MLEVRRETPAGADGTWSARRGETAGQARRPVAKLGLRAPDLGTSA
jgi:hypothetical protein